MVGGSTDMDFSEIKLFLSMTKEEIRCLTNGALETEFFKNPPEITIMIMTII